MNPLGPPDAYLVDLLRSALVYSVVAVSALLLLDVIVVYVAMVAELLQEKRHSEKPTVPLRRMVVR